MNKSRICSDNTSLTTLEKMLSWWLWVVEELWVFSGPSKSRILLEPTVCSVQFSHLLIGCWGEHEWQFSRDPLPDVSVWGHHEQFQFWLGMFTLWQCPSSIFFAYHSVTHPPRCPTGCPRCVFHQPATVCKKTDDPNAPPSPSLTAVVFPGCCCTWSGSTWSCHPWMLLYVCRKYLELSSLGVGVRVQEVPGVVTPWCCLYVCRKYLELSSLGFVCTCAGSTWSWLTKWVSMLSSVQGLTSALSGTLGACQGR